jgi:phenylacetate-coenzyme A ligase PaaK-like adenylate-forming protein
MHPSGDGWSSWTHLAELWWTRQGGIPTATIARQRLDRLVAFARESSPFYRRAYARLPQAVPALNALPAVDKRELMAHFDDWATDRHVTLAAVSAFLADPRRIGARFLGRYHAWKSSGTSGPPGIFVHDGDAIAIYDALLAAQLHGMSWNASAAARVLASGGRAALVVATGEHFASVASWERMCRAFPAMRARCFSILAPLPRLVAQLNDYRPAFLAGYPSVLALLARERRAGRLAIAPAMVWAGGEHLAPAMRADIEGAFGCPLANEYGASECLSIAHECREGWQHLHSEWVLLEAIDRDGSPTHPGQLSDDCLLTNLANRVQPIVRYRLGDRILMSPRRCGCGSPLPAFRVEGRTEDTLALATERGALVRLTPLALGTVAEREAGAHRFQIAQVGRSRLALRFEARGAGPPAAVRRNVARALHDYLASQSLPQVELVQDPSPPRADPRSGKLRAVIVERNRDHALPGR